MRAGGEIGENFSWQNGIIVNSRRKAQTEELLQSFGDFFPCVSQYNTMCSLVRVVRQGRGSSERKCTFNVLDGMMSHKGIQHSSEGSALQCIHWCIGITCIISLQWQWSACFRWSHCWIHRHDVTGCWTGIATISTLVIIYSSFCAI